MYRKFIIYLFAEAVQIIEVKSPVDQLIPITENLVKNVEKTLREIVQGAINENFSKFPTALKVVETNVVNKIFKTKRKQTTTFIQQFIEMQKKSIDKVFAPVPFPDELNNWDRKPHPCMESPMMCHLKCLAAKLHPEGMMKDIERGNNQGNFKVSSKSKDYDESTNPMTLWRSFLFSSCCSGVLFLRS